MTITDSQIRSAGMVIWRAGRACGGARILRDRNLALEHLDPVDMALDDTGVPRLGQSGDDGVKVAFEVLGEPAGTGQAGSCSG
ncbi:hypothetical protein ACF09J_34915 [Streptomyces sp. NPDC014889]|uniref:hypothetical protein n=1 Tax=Streptomyces sp. NPDC014889 TaxID=3364928 RepID=UPI0036F5032F